MEVYQCVFILFCNSLSVSLPSQGFLIESKLLKLLSPLEKDEQSLMKLDAIFMVSRVGVIGWQVLDLKLITFCVQSK